MLGKLLAAQTELESQVAELRRTAGDPGLIEECGSRLGALYALQSSLTAASAAALAGMRSEVVAAVGASSAVAQQIRVAAGNSAPAGSAQLAATSVALRQELASVNHDLFERRIFEPYLKFASPADEEAYRQREAEARGYIEQQLAAKTPEGNLNAAGATMGQMLDAHAHDAGDSPDFLPRWNRLVETTRKHRDALRAEGRSTAEFDRNLTVSVRRYLHDKGLSDIEIDAKLAVAVDPLEAVKPYLKTEQDAKALGESVNATNWLLPSADVKVTIAVPLAPPDAHKAAPPPAEHTPGLDDVMAKFRSAGVVPAQSSSADAGYAHGVDRPARDGAADGRTTPG